MLPLNMKKKMRHQQILQVLLIVVAAAVVVAAVVPMMTAVCMQLSALIVVYQCGCKLTSTLLECMLDIYNTI